MLFIGHAKNYHTLMKVITRPSTKIPAKEHIDVKSYLKSIQRGVRRYKNAHIEPIELFVCGCVFVVVVDDLL